MSNGWMSQRRTKYTNREKILHLLFQQSYRFNELFRETGFSSKSTLTKHLLELLDEGVIEKVIENRQPVYRIKMDSNVILLEATNVILGALLTFLDTQIPGMASLIYSLIMASAQLRREQKLREIMGDPLLTQAEIIEMFPSHIAESLTKLDPSIDESRRVKFVEFFERLFQQQDFWSDIG